MHSPSMMEANTYCIYRSYRYTNCLIFTLSSVLLIWDKTFFYSSESGSLQFRPVFKRLARAHQPATEKQVSEAEPEHILSCCTFSEPPLHCALQLWFLLLGFWFQLVITGQMLIPVSGCWPLVWLSGSWFLAMNIWLLSQFWIWALTFRLNSPCSSL